MFELVGVDWVTANAAVAVIAFVSMGVCKLRIQFFLCDMSGWYFCLFGFVAVQSSYGWW